MDWERGYEFLEVVGLLEYVDKVKKLIESDNSLAMVLLSHLKAMETRKDPEARARLKLDLVKRLYRKGFNREDVIRLFLFIEWMMDLPVCAG